MATTTPETEGEKGHGDNSCRELLPFKINSIYIDLDSADKNEERSREKFSIRGYVAKVKKYNEKNFLRSAWDNFKADETVAVIETSKSEPTPNFTNDINLSIDSNGISPLNIPLISTTTSMDSSFNDPPGEGMLTLYQDSQERGTQMPTPSTTQELKFLLEQENDKGLKELSDSHKFSNTPLRDDKQEEEIVISGHPNAPCLVKNDYDYSQEKAILPSINQNCSLLVDTQANMQSVGDDQHYSVSNSSHKKKTRRTRTRLLSELLSSEDGNHVVAPTRPKTGPVAGIGRNGRKKLLNDEEWRPYKTSGKNMSAKKKISNRRNKSYTHPDNFNHSMGKTCSGIPDDVPMEIVELMAKNQYERSSKNTIEDTGMAFTMGTREKQPPSHHNLLGNSISTETDAKAACNNRFNNLFDIEKHASYVEHTTMVSNNQQKKRPRSNTGLHIKSKNGINSSRNYGTAGADGYVNRESYGSGYGFSCCTTGGDHSLDSYYSNHVVPATHLLSLMNESSSRLYGRLNPSPKQVCQFGFGAVTQDYSSFSSPFDNGGSNSRESTQLFPPQPPPLYHPTQSKNRNDVQKTRVDMRRRGEVLSFPQPKGHCTSPFLSPCDDPSFGCDSMKSLDLELGWGGRPASDTGKRKMIPNNNSYSNTEPCNVNRNPSDFSAPGGRNTYMIGNEGIVRSKKKGRFFYDTCIQ